MGSPSMYGQYGYGMPNMGMMGMPQMGYNVSSMVMYFAIGADRSSHTKATSTKEDTIPTLSNKP